MFDNVTTNQVEDSLCGVSLHSLSQCTVCLIVWCVSLHGLPHCVVGLVTRFVIAWSVCLSVLRREAKRPGADNLADSGHQLRYGGEVVTHTTIFSTSNSTNSTVGVRGAPIFLSFFG